MNINMLRDSDNDPGFYAAACAANPACVTWRGCTVFASADGGTTYALAFSLASEATMGKTTNVLANFQGGNIVDELSSVNVRLNRGTLSSTDNSGLLAGTNMAVIGDEILFYRDATLQTDGSYTLGGFLRGRRGSEYAMSSHAAGDRFVLVEMAKLGRVAQSTSDIGIDKLWKAVTHGMTLATASAQDFANKATGLMPYAPVQLGGGRDASGNATLTWVRRNRISGEWRDLVDVPNSEAGEAYEVEIWDSSYATLKRTITGLSLPSTSYSVTQQTADFGAPQSTIYFRVYQLSAAVGRGHAASGSV